uniref:UTP6 small subunit processome component n=1 Tax=Oncorhynchus kisutch TaxID=8019 RepID=A0A8C7CK87_ONCKI
MAEIVQQRIENRIPELEQLERVGLFSKKEVKSMLKRATALEYKLHRLIITKVDFIAYIQYEINVLELIKKRRSRIGYQFKREEIEYSIISRINSIFRRATTKWKDDVQLWLSHIAFCKKWNTKVQLSKVFSSMLAIHPEKPALWIMAAKSELEDRNMSESARHLFLRALRFHPESKKVYQEYFRMELLHAEKLRKQQKELEQAEMDVGEYEFSPEIMSGKLAELVYRDATGKIQGADFILSLLTIAAIFDFTKELQDTIIQDLQSKYTDDSLTWDFMAKRELEATVGEELQTAKGRASDIARREERCCQVYEEGLKSLNTGTRCLMARVNLGQQVYKHRLSNVQTYSIATNRIHELQVLLSSGDSEQTAAVAMAATQRYRQSVDVWCLALQTMVHLGSGATGKLFQDALKHVNPKTNMCKHRHISLHTMSGWMRISCNSSFLLCSQRGLLSVVPAVSMEIKEKYLDWSYRAGGYKKARKTFTSLHESRPFSKAFFTRMIQVEKNQLRWSLRTVYGFSPPDLWLEYIREELGPSGQPENCGMIHWRAMKMLEGESVERFTAQYTLLQTGHI